VNLDEKKGRRSWAEYGSGSRWPAVMRQHRAGKKGPTARIIALHKVQISLTVTAPHF